MFFDIAPIVPRGFDILPIIIAGVIAAGLVVLTVFLIKARKK